MTPPAIGCGAGVRAALWAVVACACGPSARTVVVYPSGDPAPRAVLRFRGEVEVTPPDLFVLRPEERAAAAVDPGRGLVYVAGRGARLLAVGADDGKVRWEVDLAPSDVASVPVLGPKGRFLYFGTEDGEVTAVDLETHEVRWRYATEGTIRAPVLVVDGVVYATNSHQDVYALAARDGRWRWQYGRETVPDVNTIEGKAGLVHRPAGERAGEEGGTIYTCFDDGKVVALGARSGEPLWVASVAPPSGDEPFVDCDATPLYLEDRNEVVVAGRATGVYGLDADDGMVRWTFPVEGAGTVARGPGGLLVVTSSLEGAFALLPGGTLRWRRPFDPGVLSPAVVDATEVYLTHSEVGLYVLDVETGETLAVVRTGSGMSSVPVVDPIRKRLYALSNRGALMVFDVGDAAGRAPGRAPAG